MQVTRGKIERAQKVVIYGPEGIGKSTFAAAFPEPVFIDTEGSTNHMDVARLPKPSSWTMLLEQVKYVRANPSICRTLVIDTADWAEILCVNHVCSGKVLQNGVVVTSIEDFGYGKRSMDRASGSGVFARDPDALLDLIELEVPESLAKQQANNAVCAAVCTLLAAKVPGWEEHVVSQDERCSEKGILEACAGFLTAEQMQDVHAAAAAGRGRAGHQTAWRIEGTLREFPKFPPVNLWFDYPVHHLDDTEALKDIAPESEKPPWQKATDKRKSSASAKKKSKEEAFVQAVETCNFGDPPTVKMVAEAMDATERTVRDWVRSYGFIIDRSNGNVIVRDADHD